MKKLVKLRVIPNPLGATDIIQVCVRLEYKSNSIVSFLRLVLNISTGKDWALLVNVGQKDYVSLEYFCIVLQIHVASFRHLI